MFRCLNILNAPNLIVDVAIQLKLSLIAEIFFFCVNEDQEQSCYRPIYRMYNIHDGQVASIVAHAGSCKLVNHDLSTKYFIKRIDTDSSAVHDGESTHSGLPHDTTLHIRKNLFGAHFTTSVRMRISN